MTEQQKIAALIEMMSEDGTMHAGPFITNLQQIIAWLRSQGVTFPQLVQYAFAVWSIVRQGGDLASILAALAALFGIPLSPAPTLAQP